MNNTFYLSDGETTVGPFSIGEIVDQMISGQTSAEHYIYMAESEEWLQIQDFNPVMKRFEIMSRAQSQKAAIEKVEFTAPQQEFVALDEPGVVTSQEHDFVVDMKQEIAEESPSETPAFDDDITHIIPLEELLATSAPQSQAIMETPAELVEEIEEHNQEMQVVEIHNGQTVIEISHDVCDKIDLDILSNETNLAIEEAHKEINVTPGAAARFAIHGSDRAHAGDTLTLLVQAQDELTNLVDSYTGEIEVLASGSAEVVFAKIHNGRGTVRITNTKAELTEITIQDRLNQAVTGAHKIQFSAGKAVKLVMDTPANAIAGQKIQVSIRAVDQFGNTVTDFNGAIGLNIRAGKKAVQTLIAQ